MYIVEFRRNTPFPFLNKENNLFFFLIQKIIYSIPSNVSNNTTWEKYIVGVVTRNVKS